MPCRSARVATLLLSAAVLAAPPPARAEPSAPAPAFVQGACAPPLPPALAARVRCGTVAVPRDHAQPSRGTFRLAVAVIGSEVQPPTPEPDLYISGGPGGPLTVYAEAQARRPLAPGRDQILVDQRGTGASEPALCPSLDRALVAASAAFDEAGRARRRDLFMACRAEALARGIDLADFGTTVTVEDVETVRRALGVARWNVFGVSYGTTVAMTLLALHPEAVRAMVLDSVYPPDPILPPWRQTAAAAREAFLAACGASDACGKLYPDLAGTYRAALARLEERPMTVAVPPEIGRSLGLPGDRTPLTPALFAFVVDRLVYYPTFYPGLPRLIAAARDGDAGPVASAVAALFAEEGDPLTGSRLSLRAAVDCRDRPRFRGSAPAPEDLTTMEGVCDGWAPLGPPPLVPRDSAVPVLVLAGQFDPNAPPADSRAMAGMIGPRARWVEVMGVGHSVRATSPCAAAMVAAFIADPERPLDGSCAGRAPPLAVLPPLAARGP